MAPQLLAIPTMPEPDENEHHVERHVIHETVSTSSTKYSVVTIAIILVIAIVLVVWIVMQMR